jgi:(+)-trans-carveol dehydrogenase
MRLADRGLMIANIIAADIAAQVGSAPYPTSTPEDLPETVKEAGALDRRIVATRADVGLMRWPRPA